MGRLYRKKFHTRHPPHPWCPVDPRASGEAPRPPRRWLRSLRPGSTRPSSTSGTTGTPRAPAGGTADSTIPWVIPRRPNFRLLTSLPRVPDCRERGGSLQSCCEPPRRWRSGRTAGLEEDCSEWVLEFDQKPPALRVVPTHL